MPKYRWRFRERSTTKHDEVEKGYEIKECSRQSVAKIISHSNFQRYQTGMLYHFNCLFFETLTFKQKFTIDSLKEVNDHEWNLIFAKFCTARVNKNALNENLKGEPPLYRKRSHLFVVERKHPYKIFEGKLGPDSKIHALFKFVKKN